VEDKDLEEEFLMDRRVFVKVVEVEDKYSEQEKEKNKG